MVSGTGGNSGNARPTPPRIDKIWWENIFSDDEEIAGDWDKINWSEWAKIDPEKRKNKKKEDIYNATKVDYEKNKLKVTDYGKSVKIIVKTIGVPNGAKVEVRIFKKALVGKDVEIFLDKDKKDKKFTGEVKLVNNQGIAIIPIYLDPDKWCGKDKRWYEIHEYWYKGSKINPFIDKTIKPLVKMLKDQFDLQVDIFKGIVNEAIDEDRGPNESERNIHIQGRLAEENILTVWPPPALIMHAEAEVTGFYPGSHIRPIPNTSQWKKDRGYWYRLGRAYSGLGTVGTQTITYIYTKRDKVESKDIIVKDVEWRGNQGGAESNPYRNKDFEHPAPNREASDVGYKKNTNHFQFYVKHSENDIFIHGGIWSEGCFVLGGKTKEDLIPKEGLAKFVWDTMGKLLNDKDENFEKGVVKISNVTKDKMTKLDYDYPNLHLTGFDTKEFGDVPNTVLIPEEREGIKKGGKPLEDDELLKFLAKRGKNIRDENHKEYFPWCS